MPIFAQRSFHNLRPAGVKVLAGAPVLEKGMVESDFAELAAAGVTLLGEVGLGSVKAGYEAREMVAWARKYGIQSTIHTGGPSVPGSGYIDRDTVLEADADIIGHINGGHTSLSEAHVCELCERSTRAIEIVHNGNERVAIAAVQAARDLGVLHRVILGTDSPAGSGVQPLGILRMISLLSSIGGIPAAQAIALATGNTARIRKLDSGLIEPGRAADLVFLDRAQHSAGRDLLHSIELGDIPGIGGVMIDGAMRCGRSRNTPPAERVPGSPRALSDSRRLEQRHPQRGAAGRAGRWPPSSALNYSELPGLGAILADLPAAVAISAAVHIPQILLTAAAWRALLPPGRAAGLRHHGHAPLVPRIGQCAAAGRRPGRPGRRRPAAGPARRPGRLAGATATVDLTLEAVSQLFFTLAGVALLLGRRGWPRACSASPPPASASPWPAPRPCCSSSATCRWPCWSAAWPGSRAAGRRSTRPGSTACSSPSSSSTPTGRGWRLADAVAHRLLAARRGRDRRRAGPARPPRLAGRCAGDREPRPGAAERRLHAAGGAGGAGRAPSSAPPPWSGCPPGAALAVALVRRTREVCLSLPGLIAWQRAETRAMR